MKFLILCLAIGVAAAYPGGAPGDICTDKTLTPQHGKLAQDHEENPPPFIVTASRGSYQSRQKINVTISGVDGENFVGFAVAAEDEKGNQIGSWIPVKDVYHQVEGCPVATHDNKDKKSSVSLLWKAPTGKRGHVNFIVTVAKTGYVFWTGVPVNYLR